MASSFFKILIDPSIDHLSLPPDFASMHLKNKIIPNAIIIESANGGYSWRLKIKHIGDGYCFANGWNNVVQDIKLGFGDFLLFRLVDQSIVRMSIYSPDGCEKILPPKVKDHGGGHGENYDDHDYEKNEDDGDDDPFFTSVITRTHKRVLRFPGEFAELAEIDAEGSMTVKNLDGKEWVTDLKLEKTCRSTIRYYLSAGWACFVRENELSEGDECMFRFIRSEGKLLLAKVTKKKWPQPSNKFSVTKEVKRARVRTTYEHGVDVDLDSEEECVEMKNRSFEMPSKRQRGLPPQQKSRVIFF